MDFPDNSVEAKKNWLFRGGLLVSGAALAGLLGWRRERKRAAKMADALLASASAQLIESIAPPSFSDRPPPVARYFRQALREKQRIIKTAKLLQAGELRDLDGNKWSKFTAHQVVVPAGPGFVWTAEIRAPFRTHLRIIDSYIGGTGSGRVSFLSGFPVASESGARELNSGALHRYLAEAVWYPTALLPQAGVSWTPISEDAALATLTDKDTTVSLEFRFNEIGEATGIYSPGRFARFEDGYKRLPWEGRFSDYEVRAGMRVPVLAEVGWHTAEGWQPVWKGSLLHVEYHFAP